MCCLSRTPAHAIFCDSLSLFFSYSDTNTEIVVEKTSENKDYDEFVEALPEAEPRYAVYGALISLSPFDLPFGPPDVLTLGLCEQTLSTRRATRVSGTSSASSLGESGDALCPSFPRPLGWFAYYILTGSKDP